MSQYLRSQWWGRRVHPLGLGVTAHSTLIAGSLEMTGSGTGIIVRSPDGTRYRIGAANGGTVAIAAA